jgi:hypothetical protein
MKIKINESQYRRLLETITDTEVICDECGWSWALADGGNDPYICHKCGHDNEEKKHIGDKVMVYYNLHKHTFSVTYGGRVITHADYVKLSDVEFRVRQGGREKVVREKSKNVHSFVIGTLMDYCKYPCENLPSEPNDNVVTYNPYKYNSYVIKDTEEPIYRAGEVEMINLRNKIFITKQ